MIFWFYCLQNNNDNFSVYFLLFFVKIFCFFYSSGLFNDFNCLGNNVDNIFNCYSHDNNDNVWIDFQ